MNPPARDVFLPPSDDAKQVKGCTNLNQLQKLTSCNNQFRMGFFYNPNGDNQIYHITCELIGNVDNDNPLSDHTFYYRLNENNSYQISCNLISHSLIVQFLNKNIHGIELKQSEELQEECLCFSNSQRENLEFHLKQYLFNYLAQKQITNISDIEDKVIVAQPKL